jgi:hypothetical protein
MVPDQGGGAGAWVESPSRSLSGHFVQECLPLFPRGFKSTVTWTAGARFGPFVEVRSCQQVRSDRGVGIGVVVRLGMSTGLPAGRALSFVMLGAHF